jgi:hypothetical protein
LLHILLEHHLHRISKGSSANDPLKDKEKTQQIKSDCRDAFREREKIEEMQIITIAL